MPLFYLPPEILLHILRYVDSDFFAQDVDRLAINKQWHQLAWPVFLHDVILNSQSLETIYSRPVKGAALDGLQRHTDALEVKLCGFDEWSAKSDSLYPEANLRDMAKWTTRLGENLDRLSALFRKSIRLKSLTIEAKPELAGMRASRRAYLSISTIQNMISIESVTCLDIDTGGTALSSRRNKSLHLCDAISRRLPHLRRLRCRACLLCPEILRIQPDSTYTNLEEVIINLSLSGMTPQETAYQYPARCNHSSFLTVRAALEDRAITLAGRMDRPKMVRLIWHSLPSMQILAFDATDGRLSRLKSLDQWDAEGEEIRDELPSSESEIGSVEFDSSEASESEED